MRVEPKNERADRSLREGERSKEKGEKNRSEDAQGCGHGKFSTNIVIPPAECKAA
jgi:hypothetical protein